VSAVTATTLGEFAPLPAGSPRNNSSNCSTASGGGGGGGGVAPIPLAAPAALVSALLLRSPGVASRAVLSGPLSPLALARASPAFPSSAAAAASLADSLADSMELVELDLAQLSADEKSFLAEEAARKEAEAAAEAHALLRKKAEMERALREQESKAK